MKISFLDFWAGFDSEDNFLFSLIKQIRPNATVTHDPLQADVIIYSCFGWNHVSYDKRKKIFYTGENVRPNYDFCSLSLSFDLDSDRNIRLPLWNIYIDWSDLSYLKENKYHAKRERKFCSFVYSNPIPIRQEIIQKLNLYKPVDCFGRIHELKISDSIEDKLDIISDYKFNLCFENSASFGYYTEKLLHAKIANCVPLYFSDKNYGMDFNERCCLNLCNYENMDSFVDSIIEMDKNDSSYISMLNEPIFNSEPSLDDIKERLNNFLSNIKLPQPKMAQITHGINLQDLKVYQSPTDKIRIGKDYDGGYIISSDRKYDIFLSAGICDDVSFEEDFLLKYPYLDKCFAFDGTIEKLPKTTSNIIFHKLNIGEKDTESTTNLKQYLEEYQEAFIKMDIEGYEYEWINSLEDKHLNSISQLVIEFHHPYEYYKWVILLRLLNYFTLVHFHGNICGGEFLFNGAYVPRVFECTFIRKVANAQPSLIPIPDPKLDQPNRAISFDYFLKNGHIPFDL